MSGLEPASQGAWERLKAIRDEVRREGGGVSPVRPRLLRQIIKADRDVIGFGLDVAHADSYVMPLAELERLVDQEAYLLDTAGLPDPALLIAEPSPDELEVIDTDVLRRRMLALEYHAKVHARLEGLARGGRLGDAQVERFFTTIGHDAAREAVLALEAEHRLLDPRTPTSELIELVATYNEARAFAPYLVDAWFPSLEADRMDDASRALGAELDPAKLLGPGRVKEAERLSVRTTHEMPAYDEASRVLSADADGEADPEDPPEDERVGPNVVKVSKLLKAAARKRAAGNFVRAIKLRRQAQRFLESGRDRRALTIANDTDLRALVERLVEALGGEGPTPGRWVQVLRPLVRDPGHGLWSRRTTLLYDLQKACTDAERPGFVLDVVGWAVSGGKQPVRRTLTDQIPVRVHRHIRTALARALKLRGAPETTVPLIQALREAGASASRRIRDLFRQDIRVTLDAVGLVPQNLAEVAAAKVTDELLDRIVGRDYVSFSDLRDALSQNNLKMQDMQSVRKLVLGDALLSADQVLAKRLEGVYRKSPIYMRMLQRTSSLAFGNPVGRLLTRFAAIPFIGAFVALEGLKHMGELLASPFGYKPHDLFVSTPTVLAAGLLVIALIESARLRQAAWLGVKTWFAGLKAVFYNLPRKIVRLPIVLRIRDSYGFAIFRRFVLKPLIPAAIGIVLLDCSGVDRTTGLFVCGGVYLLMTLFLNSRVGRQVEARFGDELSLYWARIRHRLLPNLFRFVMETSRRVLGFLERMAYSVDEVLRFRKGDRRVAFAVKLVGGSAWSVVMYVLQFAMNLLIEPQINPIKHFPVVTVSHKVLAGFQPFLAKYIGTAASLNVIFAIPGFFGFLAWELSANWKLYEASRPRKLGPIMVGSHGETVSRLLRPGFHSGTIPKLFAKIRKAGLTAYRTGVIKTRRKDLEELHHIEESLRRFFERELIALLERTKGFGKPLQTGHIHLGSTQIRVAVELEGEAETNAEPVLLKLAERPEGLVARVEPGFTAALPVRERALFADAFCGVLMRAEVDVVELRNGAELETRSLEDEVVPWTKWVARWEADKADVDAEPLVADLPLFR